MALPNEGIDLQVQPITRFGLAIDSVVAGGDLVTLSGFDNLAQALWLRLSMPVGELAPLGHPEYGSRLPLLIGRLMNTQTIALAKAYTREALRHESRIAEVLQVDAIANPIDPQALLIHIQLIPVGQADPINLSLNFILEPGQAEANVHAAIGQ